MAEFTNLISVIIPVYNCPETTKTLLQKLSYQKAHHYPETEIIAVDDASTEDMSIMDSIEGITVVHRKTNRGTAATLNFGMKMAKGDYFAFCDCDDDITDDYLHVMYQDIRKGFDYVAYNWNYKDEYGWHYTDMKEGHSPFQNRWSNAVWAYCFNRRIFTNPWKLFDEKLNVGFDKKWLDRVFTPYQVSLSSLKAIYIYDATRKDSVTRRYIAGEIPERRK